MPDGTAVSFTMNPEAVTLGFVAILAKRNLNDWPFSILLAANFAAMD